MFIQIAQNRWINADTVDYIEDIEDGSASFIVLSMKEDKPKLTVGDPYHAQLRRQLRADFRKAGE